MRVGGVGSGDLAAEVVIVGLGPVGAVLAALLGEQGIDVLVIEAETEITPFPRAIAADGETLRTLLDVLGPNGGELFLLDRAVQVRDGRQRLITTIDFPAVEDGQRNPIAQPGLSFFHQPSLERALRGRLAAHPSVRVRLGARLRAVRDGPDSVVAVLEDGTCLRARWLVGCDGASSLVRRARAIAYAGRSFAQPWLVVDLECPTTLPGFDGFRYVLDPVRPAVAMPRPGGHRVEFMLHPGEPAAALTAPGPLADLLRPYLSGLTAADRAAVRVSRAAGYTFHARSARHWRDGRVLLAGDAAHSMPPFGGQGMGAGVADAAALSWRLADVCRGSALPGVLDAYEREQRPRVDAMTQAALTIGRLLTPTTRSAAAATRTAIRLMSAAPVVGQRFRSGALRSAVTAAVPSAERQLGGGAALPNPRVRTPDGTVQRLDQLLVRRWVAIAGHTDPRALLAPATIAALRERAGQLWSLGPDGLEDLDGTLTAHFRTGSSDRILLARPDRVIAAVSSPEEVAAVLARLTSSRPA